MIITDAFVEAMVQRAYNLGYRLYWDDVKEVFYLNGAMVYPECIEARLS